MYITHQTQASLHAGTKGQNWVTSSNQTQRKIDMAAKVLKVHGEKMANKVWFFVDSHNHNVWHDDVTDNQATTPFSCYPAVMAFLPVQPHCANVRQNRCQEDLNYFPPWRTGGDHQDTLILRGWRLSSKTWNPKTSPWMKQLTWLRIFHSGDWCLRLVLRTPSGDCQSDDDKDDIK